MRNHKSGLSVFFDAVAMVILWAAAVVSIGFIFRAMKHLFCVGYGC
jgi:hypothetical protein